MNIIPWLLLAALMCFLSFRALKRTREREHTHEALVNRVKRLRLYKMLQFLGADQDEYLRAVPIASIIQQIERCSSCNTIEICDRYLRDGQRVDSMSFCPNYKSLSEQSQTVHLYRKH